ELEEMQSPSGTGTSGNLEVVEIDQHQIAGRRGVRARFELRVPDQNMTLEGILFSVNHDNEALVVQYLAGTGSTDRLISFANDHIQTLSLK
ncbi:MAG: hypothetical protein ACLFSE_13795, partial [Spirochaetia bacterium]